MIKSYLFCLVAIFFFSTIEVVTKVFDQGISPLVVTFIRFLIGALIIFPFAFERSKKKGLKLGIKDYLLIGYPGILNITIAMFSLQLAVYFGKASLSGILISSNPIFVAIFASLILKEHLTFNKFIGISLGIMGIILVIGAELYADSLNLVLGIIFGCIASVSFGLYTVLSKKYVKRYGNLTFNCYSFLIGSLTLMTVGLITGIEFKLSFSTTNILVLLYLGIFVSGMAYLFFFQGIRNIPAANGSIFFLLKPVIVVILSYIFLEETIGIFQVIGVIFVIISIYVSNYRKPVKKILAYNNLQK